MRCFKRARTERRWVPAEWHVWQRRSPTICRLARMMCSAAGVATPRRAVTSRPRPAPRPARARARSRPEPRTPAPRFQERPCTSSRCAGCPAIAAVSHAEHGPAPRHHTHEAPIVELPGRRLERSTGDPCDESTLDRRHADVRVADILFVVSHLAPLGAEVGTRPRPQARRPLRIRPTATPGVHDDEVRRHDRGSRHLAPTPMATITTPAQRGATTFRCCSPAHRLRVSRSAACPTSPAVGWPKSRSTPTQPSPSPTPAPTCRTSPAQFDQVDLPTGVGATGVVRRYVRALMDLHLTGRIAMTSPSDHTTGPAGARR